MRAANAGPRPLTSSIPLKVSADSPGTARSPGRAGCGNSSSCAHMFPQPGDPALVQQRGDDRLRPGREHPSPVRSVVANRGCRTSHAVIEEPAVTASSRAARRALSPRPPAQTTAASESDGTHASALAAAFPALRDLGLT